ncbi:hypothetical protein BGZ73_003606 [Actinomortierella ambigua]|nr:hypothetical protein BGZ73_003606 [Actinomortierella ambigua]
MKALSITFIGPIAAAILLATVAPAEAALPTPVDVETATKYLESLKVEQESNDPPYDRKLFPHWKPVSGRCDTRETVLKRDGTDVQTNSLCAAVSGSWYSPYDGKTFDQGSKLDIDHMVPLKEAWVSGAHSWTTAQRQAYANDLTNPVLLAVSAASNRAKADKDPAEWMPPLASYHCEYLRAYIQVKHHYELSVDEAEKAALTSKLAECE